MISYEQLRNLYLDCLKTPDTFHGRETPKVRDIKVWEAITPKSDILIEAHTNVAEALDYNIQHKRNWYFWSDIHWGHKNIIKYSNRPFGTVEQMNEAMIQNYINTVADDDVCIFGGDIGFLSENNINNILARLPGYKIWIVGNHDIHRNGKVYELDFDERHISLPITIKDGDKTLFQLLVTHYPMDTVPNKCLNVHGHIHTNLANAWNINMCVEHTNYGPMHINQVIEKALRYLENA